MRATGITRAQLIEAAVEVGVLLDMTPLNQAETRWRVKVHLLVPESCYTPDGRRRRGEAGNARYQRLSASYLYPDRRVYAVCWHGFRDFFRACFRRSPHAIFRTMMDTWNGSADFERRYRESGYRNIGCQAVPIKAAEACRCGEEGIVA